MLGRFFQRTALMFVELVLMLVVPLEWAFRKAMRETRVGQALPRLTKFAQHAFQKRGYGRVLAGGRGWGFSISTAAIAAACLTVAIPVAALFLAVHGSGDSGTLLLATTAAVKPANIRQMEADFKAIAKELEIGQSEMAAGPITQARGEELEAKAKEMESLQQHLDQYNRVAGIVKKAREVESPTMPTDAKGKGPKRLITTPGHLFVASDAYRQYRASGKQGWSAKVEIKSIRGGKVLLIGDEAVAFETKAFDAATLPDLGDDAIIQPDRDDEIIRFEEPEILNMRDVLNVVGTSSDSVRFIRHVATERAAASQASRGAAKDYLKVSFEPDTVPVETIAVLSKVTEQDIDDAPRLVGFINGEMRLDVKTEEERQLLWGNGASGELNGLFNQGIEEFDRAAVDDTIIDTIRRMRTDLRKRRVVPNFVAIDPLDWEVVETSKGTDDRYIWGMITDLRGPRIWSLRVVETDAMTNPDTLQRRLLVGDGIRGATLYDRHDVRLAVGYVDDDFARNLRTLRAEERIALGVKRAWAFEYTVTAEATVS